MLQLQRTTQRVRLVLKPMAIPDILATSTLHGGCGIPPFNSEHGKLTVDSRRLPGRMTLSLLAEVSQVTQTEDVF